MTPCKMQVNLCSEGNLCPQMHILEKNTWGSFENELLTSRYLASPSEILIPLMGPSHEVFFRSSWR